MTFPFLSLISLPITDFSTSHRVSCIAFSIMADHGDHDRVFCHACGGVWLKDDDGLTCPHCESDFTEIVRYSILSQQSSTDYNHRLRSRLMMLLLPHHRSSLTPQYPRLIHGQTITHGRKKIIREPLALWILPPAPLESPGTLTDPPMVVLHSAAPRFATDIHPAKLPPRLMPRCLS